MTNKKNRKNKQELLKDQEGALVMSNISLNKRDNSGHELLDFFVEDQILEDLEPEHP